MLFDAKNFVRLHLRWCLSTLLALALCCVWYGIEARGRGRWPGGSSLPGLTFGIVAAAICLFETAIAFRKTWLFRTQRLLLSAQTWMKAHIWLGLLALPLVLMHAGFEFRATFSWLLAWTFILVVASGVFGLILQNILPRLMIALVPSETVFSQLDQVGDQFAEDARRMAWLHGGLDRKRGADRDRQNDGERLPMVGAQRSVGTVRKRIARQQEETKAFEPSPALYEAVEGEIAEFLRTGRSPSGKLRTTERIDWFFEDLRSRVRPEAREAVDEIKSLCQRRRQFNLQKRLHYGLHLWVSVHVLLTAILMWLLLGHIVLALRYN